MRVDEEAREEEEDKCGPANEDHTNHTMNEDERTEESPN